VILDVPLVSGGAISSAGQWAVYGGRIRSSGNRAFEVEMDGKSVLGGGSTMEPEKEEERRRACYRCVWPRVISGSGGNGNCEEEGVWGVGVGTVGVGMAGEVIKLLLRQDGAFASPFPRSSHPPLPPVPSQPP
jgi:adenylyltransferase/sulfurtransferase